MSPWLSYAALKWRWAMCVTGPRFLRFFVAKVAVLAQSYIDIQYLGVHYGHITEQHRYCRSTCLQGCKDRPLEPPLHATVVWMILLFCLNGSSSMGSKTSKPEVWVQNTGANQPPSSQRVVYMSTQVKCGVMQQASSSELCQPMCVVTVIMCEMKTGHMKQNAAGL